MPAPAKVRYTYADYLATPEDSSRYEVVDGELFVTAAPRFRHQEVVANILWLLGSLAREHGLGKVVGGPITVRLHDELVTEPDVAFLRDDRLNLVQGGRIHGAPDLVVEVLSPSNRRFDRDLKRAGYLDHGVPELWLVDADENTIEVWRSGVEPRTLLGGSVDWRTGALTFEIPLAEIFRG
ncbi:MAG: Uma2 family endonuclease [Longimicrobiales bacterium]